MRRYFYINHENDDRPYHMIFVIKTMDCGRRESEYKWLFSHAQSNQSVSSTPTQMTSWQRRAKKGFENWSKAKNLVWLFVFLDICVHIYVYICGVKKQTKRLRKSRLRIDPWEKFELFFSLSQKKGSKRWMSTNEEIREKKKKEKKNLLAMAMDEI